MPHPRGHRPTTPGLSYGPSVPAVGPGCDRRCRRASRVVRRASRPRLYRGRPDRPGRCDRGGGARVLGRLPERLTVLAVVGCDFGFGTELTAEVAAAVPELVERVREIVR